MESYRLIPLSGKRSGGKFAKVSSEDFERVSQFVWFLTKNDEYAHRNASRVGLKSDGVKLGAYRCEKMHRFILNAPVSSQVDHINGDRLDNRRENLRLCSIAENACNRRPNKGQRFKGVHFSKRNKRYQAYIRWQSKRVHLGYFDTA